MIKSMTGFASVALEDERVSMSVTIRAVNHRYLDLQLRLPQSLATLEPDVRALVTRRVARGRVELNLSLQLRQTPEIEVEFNDQFGRALETALEQARARGLITGKLGPGDLLRLPQALSIRERAAAEDPTIMEGIAACARQLVDRAITELDAMRSREGEHLRADLDQRKAEVAALVERVALAAEAGRAALEQRLIERVTELRTVLQADETLVAQEIAKFVGRSDITEEVVRFRGHLEHWQALTDSPEPCGRKLDFLLQEMNREVNTLASKAEGAGVSELVVALKAELERLREQVQNVE